LEASTTRNRLELIDFLRGVAIIEMIVTHFAAYLPAFLATVVVRAETAMPLFVLLAGFIVGYGTARFRENPIPQTLVLWRRAGRVLLAQYIIIATVSLPLHLLRVPGYGTEQTVLAFLTRSMLFLNQISIIHILPTFIPLFLIAPLISLGLSNSLDIVVLAVSAALFSVGHFHPYVLDLGQPTIFPFILFQLYFVLGCIWGKHSQRTRMLSPAHPERWLLASLALLGAMLALFHLRIIPQGLMREHPLNFFGLIYEVPIMLTLYFSSVTFWQTLRKIWPFAYVTLIGRHALLAFVIHLYCAKLIAALNYFATITILANYALLISSVLVMVVILRQYEADCSTEPAPTWAVTLRALFR